MNLICQSRSDFKPRKNTESNYEDSPHNSHHRFFYDTHNVSEYFGIGDLSDLGNIYRYVLESHKSSYRHHNEKRNEKEDGKGPRALQFTEKILSAKSIVFHYIAFFRTGLLSSHSLFPPFHL